MKKTVNEETITFVEFFYPGLLLSGTSTREVDNRSKPKRIPKNAYSYRFFDKVKITIDENEVFWKKAKNYSGQHFIDAEKLSLAEVKKRHGNDRKYKILISNMEINRYDHVVKCRTGNFQPLEKGDEIV